MKLSSVDVVIPFHIVNSYLLDAIFSVKNSTYQNIRIVAVNDSGINVSREILGLSETDLMVDSARKGYLGALATGVSISSSDYVSFLDSDDLLHPDKISVQVLEIERRNADLVTGEIIGFRNSIKNSFKPAMKFDVLSELTHREKLLFGAYGADSTMLFRSAKLKQFWQIHSNFPPRLADYAWFLSCIDSIDSIHAKNSIYYYRSHNLQMSRSGDFSNEWPSVHSLWLDNLISEFNISDDLIPLISSRVSQAIAFPSTLPNLNRKDKDILERVLYLLRVELTSRYPIFKRDINNLTGIRMTIAHRGLSLPYFRYTLLTLMLISRGLFSGSRVRRK